MTSIVDAPGESRGTLRFRLLGVPVRVLSWFWLMTLCTAGVQDTTLVLIWIAVVFVSILVHELGHVLAFRAFRVEAEVLMYGWGGLAIPTRGYLRNSLFPQVMVSAWGPLAGFILAGAVVAVGSVAGARFDVSFPLLVIPSIHAYVSDPLWYTVLNDLLWVNIYWGIVNLLPVYPMDGSHIAEALLDRFYPAGSKRAALRISAITASVIAALALLSYSVYLALMFGFLAFGSIQRLNAMKPIFPRRASESWRR